MDKDIPGDEMQVSCDHCDHGAYTAMFNWDNCDHCDHAITAPVYKKKNKCMVN
jgi:hypothetical protein